MSRLLPLVFSQADVRSRWFFGFFERQTLQSQKSKGTPVEVPQPRMVNSQVF
jgi:hypothetical protein